MRDELVIYYKWSAGVIFSTILVCLVFVTIAAAAIADPSGVETPFWPVLVMLVILASMAFTPHYIRVTPKEVEIKRLAGRTTISTSRITAVGQIDKKALRGSFSLLANNGFFGYVGHFTNRVFGRYTMYATERRNLVCIQTAGTNYVVSCRQPERLVQTINAICFPAPPATPQAIPDHGAVPASQPPQYNG